MSNRVVISQKKNLFSQVEFVIEGKSFKAHKINRALLNELAEWRKKVDAGKIPAGLPQNIQIGSSSARILRYAKLF